MQRDDDKFIYKDIFSEKVIAAVKRVLKESRFNRVDREDRNKILKMILENHGMPAGPPSAAGATSGRDQAIDNYARVMILTYRQEIIHRRAERITKEQMDKKDKEAEDWSLEEEEDWSLEDYDSSGSRLNTKLQREIRQLERVGAMVDRKLMKLRRKEAHLSKHL